MPLSWWECPSQCPFPASCSLAHLIQIRLGQAFILGAWTCRITALRWAQRLQWLDEAGVPGLRFVLRMAEMLLGGQGGRGEDLQVQRPGLDGPRCGGVRVGD